MRLQSLSARNYLLNQPTRLFHLLLILILANLLILVILMFLFLMRHGLAAICGNPSVTLVEVYPSYSQSLAPHIVMT